MYRCLELARKGMGNVAPNPMVGAVLVHHDIIIGEGYHEKYGEAHAEVNCIRWAIENGFSAKLSSSTLYVSLEPCAHFGKTPPCADLIIHHRIPRVVVGCRDPFPEVDGKGIEKLKAAGIIVELGVLEEECKDLNKRFFCFHTLHRPYVVLKWAQTADNLIAAADHTQRLLISNDYSNQIVHKWRSEEMGILVGTNTALWDDPALTNRLWPGQSPIRLVLDKDLRLPNTLKLFESQGATIVFNTIKQEESGNILHYKLDGNESIIQQLLRAFYDLKIQSILVEGGSHLLQSFIAEQTWDEARIITNTKLKLKQAANGKPGIEAPVLSNHLKKEETELLFDKIEIYQPTPS